MGKEQAQPMTIDDMELTDVNSIYTRQHKLSPLSQHKTTDVHRRILDSVSQLSRTHSLRPTTTPSPSPQLRHHNEQELERLQAAAGSALHPAHDRLSA